MSRLSYTNLETFKGTKTWENKTLYNIAAVGSFALPKVYNDFIVYPVEQWELDSFLKDVIVKKDCKIFRYETETSKIGGFAPIIEINMTSGLVFFNTGEDEVAFETKSAKPTYINLNINQK